MFKIDSIVLSISDKKIKEHQRITGDTDELSAHVYKTMIENETGLCFEEASIRFSEEELSAIVLERINIELSAFGG